MRTCINGATTMPYSLQDDIASADKAGFDGIEIWKAKLDHYMEDHRKDEVKDLMSSNNLEVSAICAFSGYVWCSETEFVRKTEDAKKYFDIASLVGCESLLICGEAPRGRDCEEVIEAHVKRLRKLADIGKDYGIRLELEWFQNLRDAIKVVELANHQYLGLMIDTFHWYRGDGNLAHIDAIPEEKLFLVHINDCENMERAKLTDRNRLYCGEGVIPLVEILQKLKRKGYERHLSVEIFREEYWEKDPLTISNQALATLKTVMRRATCLE